MVNVWFAMSTLFKGGAIAWSALDLSALAIAAAVFGVLTRWNVGVQWVVIAGGLIGLARHLL